ncbi:hypothetical protein C2E20_4392 [Micractinium conductrix]|uniref:Uncharacterized protein n=1 Tax=Micractinium conductrix TaxID=554055 RepID=A0A2P6VDK5_9CHLO|nr:hypothetical protein C2E20_4392 [Micractinium conductrix]|eukprot:PSC72190.1 hypothetical protein C2E20_4392 [Micractinium conductrix]
MAALDCFLELEQGASPAPGRPAAPARAAASAPSPLAWLWKQQQLKAQQQRQQQQQDLSDDESACTSSPGCSYSAGAAAQAGLLDLADDACSSSGVPASPATASAAQRLSDGTPLVAAAFFDDLAAGGSLYQYCLQQR